MKFIIGAALALAMVLAPFSGMPAEAADGFHAAFFSESSFLTLSPGQSGQFSVGFANTGTLAWIKGQANAQASLHTAAPADNPLDFTAGWASNWTAPNIYSVQVNQLVAPGQVAFFTYDVKVPATQALGTKTFYGRPSIDGVGFMEDYGYYQVVTIAGGVRITTVTPASPSAEGRPTIAGVGAGANEIVTITDGIAGAAVATTTADAQGNFSIQLINALTTGSHSLYASTTSKGQSAPSVYTVTSSSSGPIVVNAYATAQSTLVVNFSVAMKCTNASERTDMLYPTNYFINETPTGTLGPVVSSVTASADCTQATLNVGSLTLNKSYQVLVYFARSGSGTVIDSSRNTANFSIGSPNVLTWTSSQNGIATVTYNRSMNITSGATGGQSVLNPQNYTVDSISAPSGTTVACLTSGLNGCISVQITFPGGGSSVLGLKDTVHTLGVVNVIDAITGGQLIVPNPSTRQLPTQ